MIAVLLLDGVVRPEEEATDELEEAVVDEDDAWRSRAA
jgi:hypothetical protein